MWAPPLPALDFSLGGHPGPHKQTCDEVVFPSITQQFSPSRCYFGENVVLFRTTPKQFGWMECKTDWFWNAFWGGCQTPTTPTEFIWRESNKGLFWVAIREGGQNSNNSDRVKGLERILGMSPNSNNSDGVYIEGKQQRLIISCISERWTKLQQLRRSSGGGEL